MVINGFKYTKCISCLNATFNNIQLYRGIVTGSFISGENGSTRKKTTYPPQVTDTLDHIMLIPLPLNGVRNQLFFFCTAGKRVPFIQSAVKATYSFSLKRSIKTCNVVKTDEFYNCYVLSSDIGTYGPYIFRTWEKYTQSRCLFLYSCQTICHFWSS